MGKKDDPRNYRPLNLSFLPGNITVKIILEGIEKHLKGNAVFGHSQHGFMTGKSCLLNLISLYDMVTHLDDQEKHFFF